MNTSTSNPQNKPTTGLMWFRRDLRHNDNAALFFGLKQCDQLHCVFVFDTNILNPLPNKKDRRIEFIWESVKELKQALTQLGGDLHVLHGQAEDEIPKIAKQLQIATVFTNHDYEPEARNRDKQVEENLNKLNIKFNTYKDQVVFEKSEILTQNGTVYSVFSPYKKAWFKHLKPHHLRPFDSKKITKEKLFKTSKKLPLISLKELGFEQTNLKQLIEPGMTGAQKAFSKFLNRINHYHTNRDYPGTPGVSYLSLHNRFGTISIRELAQQAQALSQSGSEGALTWLNELIWRDFYFQILWHNPQVTEQSFKPEYDKIKWVSGETETTRFDAWCKGETGYPLVDAAMRQLNQTGYQHNRLRMVTASFLCKSLGVNWRKGEQYFADQLNDFDLAANNGGWQWAASSGCDAQPYFRIFNPVTQSERFDAQGKFIRKYCPELSQLSNKLIHKPWLSKPSELNEANIKLGDTYPAPIVNHSEERKNTLDRYDVVKKPSK